MKMIIQEKKKEIELGIYEQEIFDSLQEAYKKRFSKYVNEQNYEIYSFEKHEDIEEISENNDNAINFTTELKKPTLEIGTQNINIIESFKKFIGKDIEIHLAKEKSHNICYEEKEKKKIPFINIEQEKNKQIGSRIVAIRKTIFDIKNSIISNNEWINKKQNEITNLFEKLKQIEDILYSIVKFGEFADMNFRNNLNQYKYINNNFIHKEQNVFDVIKKIKFISDNKDLPNTTQVLLPNLVSFQNQLFHVEFENVQTKINRLTSLFHNNCFEKGENIANVLFSISFFFSLGLNENVFKRIMNYISLEYLKLKNWKQYLEHDTYRKQEHIISVLKSIVNKYCDKENLKNVFHIDIREYDKNILTIYKKILKNELNTQIISAEVNKITEAIQQLDENLKKDTVKLKYIFSKLPK